LPHVGLLVLERKHAPWDVGVGLFLLLIVVALLRALPTLSML